MNILDIFLKLNNIKYALFGILFFLSVLPIVFLDRQFAFWRDVPKISFGLLGIIAARSLGVIVNQISDRHPDFKNPRTCHRPIASREVAVHKAAACALFSLVVFLFCSSIFGKESLIYSLICMGLMIIYPLFKKFSIYCHFILGSIYCLAVLNVFCVLSGKIISLKSLLMGTAIGLTITANDIAYALYDIDFDRKEGLYSIPARYTIKRVFRIISFIYCISLFCLILLGVISLFPSDFYMFLALPAGAMFFNYRRLVGNFFRNDQKCDTLFIGNVTIAFAFCLMTCLFFFKRMF
ncbi:MAG: UbiA family prenyltransferase [Victivallaceae bacterium]